MACSYCRLSFARGPLAVGATWLDLPVFPSCPCPSASESPAEATIAVVSLELESSTAAAGVGLKKLPSERLRMMPGSVSDGISKVKHSRKKKYSGQTRKPHHTQ